jgi:hypothetical protein
MLVAVALAGSAGWLWQRWPGQTMRVVYAPRPIYIIPPSSGPASSPPQPLSQGQTIPPGSLLSASQNSALEIGGVSLRIDEGTRLRFVKGSKAGFLESQVSLEEGRIWVERTTTSALVVQAGSWELYPGLGNCEIRMQDGVPTVYTWSAPCRVRWTGSHPLQEVLPVMRKVVLARRDTWKMSGLDRSQVDAWQAWNLRNSGEKMASGRAVSAQSALASERRDFPPASGGLPPPPLQPPPSTSSQAGGGPVALHPPSGPSLPQPPGPPTPPAWQPPPRPTPFIPSPPPRARRSPGGRQLPRFTIPQGLTSSGRDEVDPHAYDLSTPSLVRNRTQALSVLREVQSFLTRRFGMSTSEPLELTLVKDEPVHTGYVSGGVAWSVEQLRISGNSVELISGLPEDTFASYCAIAYAHHWLDEYTSHPGRDEAFGFGYWCAYKYAFHNGNRSEARTIAMDMGVLGNTTSTTQTGEKFFRQLWEIEEKYGERGVLQKVLGRQPGASE